MFLSENRTFALPLEVSDTNASFPEASESFRLTPEAGESAREPPLVIRLFWLKLVLYACMLFTPGTFARAEWRLLNSKESSGLMQMHSENVE